MFDAQGKKATKAAGKAKNTPVKTPPTKAKKAKKPPTVVTKSAKKKASVTAVTNRSSDKRAAVLAKKRGMSAKAIQLAETKAKKANNARAKPAKVAPKMGKVRVGKKVVIAAVRTTRKKNVSAKAASKGGNKNANFASPANKPFQLKGFSAPESLRISIINDLATPPKPKPGSQRAVARGKVQSGASVRKASAQHRQANGRGGKIATSRSFGLASRLGDVRTVKTPTGVTKKKGKNKFPQGTSVSGKKQVNLGKAKGPKKRKTVKRR